MLDILQNDPLLFVLLAAALACAIGLHEYAHAVAADLQGDRLPRAMGRLTPNPIKHLDPIGTLMLLIAGFGWGKPVEFRTQALSSKRFGAAIVALAGPMMNVFLALVGALGYVQLLDQDPTTFVGRFLLIFFGINVLLAVFNLIPLPPLDGSRLLTIFLPPKRQNIIFFLDRYGFIILVVLLLLTRFTFLNPIIDGVEGFLCAVTGGDPCPLIP